ncbi:MAG: Ig-like domain-containing protein [Deltaproteobacteria bacterium]|nr:Ig-like domain-containing protein [Deltaproteobacteria bacterium]
MRQRSYLAPLFFLAAGLSAAPALAALSAVGPPAPLGAPTVPPTYPAVMPHGFPGFYSDGNGLATELCLDPPDPVTLGPCFFDPVVPGNAWSATTGFGAEAFYFMATATGRPLVTGGRTLLVLAVEAAYGGDGSPVANNQIVFTRVRVRFDAPGPAHYRILHPYGTLDLPAAFVAESLSAFKDVRLTADIGGVNPLDPAAAFAGALNGFDPQDPTIVSFLTWDTFNADPALTDPLLKTVDPLTGAVTAQYLGDGVLPHVVTGSAIADATHPSGFRNYFRIQIEDAAAPGGFRTVSDTDLFVVTGKVHVPPALGYDIYTYTNLPVQNLWAVGPESSELPVSAVGAVNRAANWPAPSSNLPSPGAPAGLVTPAIPPGNGYPIGFPYWYQERVPVPDPLNPGLFIDGGGVQLTLCPGADPMCISMPVDPSSAASVALGVGAESFYWSATGDIAFRQTVPVRRDIDAKLILAVEAAFGNPLGDVFDGDQVVFVRIRYRVKVDQPGTYTVAHPYGDLTFTATAAGEVRYTDDVGIITAGTNPDAGFIGALFGKVNPFLKWSTFNADPALTDPALKFPGPAGSTLRYVGNPLIRHAVLGSTIADAAHPSGFRNYLRVTDTAGLDTGMMDQFVVTGKVYDPLTFAAPPAAAGPVAVGDAGAIPTGQTLLVNVLANDVFTAPVSSLLIAPAIGPFSGTVAINGTAIAYTPAPGFVGVDTFGYQLIDSTGLTSNVATVNVNVVPVEALTVTRAELVVSKRQWNIQGTAAPGATVAIFAGPTLGGASIGGALADTLGVWRFRGVAFANPDTLSISISSSSGNSLLNQPVRLR